MNPEDYQMYTEAVGMLKNNDSGCIEIFQKLDTYSCRIHLARIYMDGKCGQEVDYEKALEYTKNNPNYQAFPIEARINCILLKKRELYEFYFDELNKICEENPDNQYGKLVLAEMYLHGKGTKMDLQMALNINPRLSDIKTLHWELSFMDEETKERVKAKMMRDPVFVNKMGVFEEQKPVPETHKETKYKEKRYSPKKKAIDDLIEKGANKEQIADLCLEWFYEEPSPESAYYLIRNNARVDGFTAEQAIDYMKKSSNVIRYQKMIAQYYLDKSMWDDLENILKSYDSRELDYYWAKLMIQKGDREGAVRYLLSTIKQNKTQSGYTTLGIQAMRMLFEVHPEWVTYYIEYREYLLNTKNNHIIDQIGTALYEHGSPADKKRAMEILDENSKEYAKSAETMYKITSDKKYKAYSKKYSFYKSSDNTYQFNYTDNTETILKNYKTLSPKWRLTAIEELTDRYIRGRMDTPKDYGKAADLLIENIELCEEYKLTSKHAKGKLGLMMFNKQIPCLDEKLMFNYLYGMKNNRMIRLAVIDCILNGIGTAQNVEEAIELLRQSDLRFEVKKLIKIYEEEQYNKIDPKMVAEIVKEMINKGQLTKYLIEKMRESNRDDFESTIELSLPEYNASKITKLMSAAENSKDNKELRLRCLDFARRLGSADACGKEASLLIREYNRPKIAYTILKESDYDATSFIMRVIKIKDQVLVDSDRELKRLMFG